MNIIPHGARETFCEAKLICVCCGCVCVYLSRLFIFPKLYSIWLFIFTFLELPLGVFLHPVQSFNYFYQFVVFTLKHTEYSHCVVIKITMGGVMMWLLYFNSYSYLYKVHLEEYEYLSQKQGHLCP